MKRKLALLLVLALVACSCLAGCGGNKSDETENIITVGCEATTPGWITQKDDGTLEGYDYDVWMEIGERIGYTVEFQVQDWDGMWAMFDDQRIDSIGEQISVTPDRAEKYNLSDPYAYNRYCLLSATDNEALQSLDDLKDGMTISCESNTSDDLVVNALDKEYGVTLERTYYDGMSVADVAMGRCDLWPRAETSCIITVQEVENLKILGKTNILETNAYPFAKSERGEELCALVNQALAEMKEDGTLAELSEKWFGQDISVQPEGAELLASYQ